MTNHLDDQRLSRLLDGDLSLAERAAALSHLSGCSACAGRQSELVEVAATLRSHQGLEWTPGHTADVLTHLSDENVGAVRRPALPVTLVFCVFAAVLILATLRTAPIGPQLASGMLNALTLLPPLQLAASGHALVLALLAVVVVAPALVYPLARWR
jgi:hypothetical protein